MLNNPFGYTDPSGHSEIEVPDPIKFEEQLNASDIAIGHTKQVGNTCVENASYMAFKLLGLDRSSREFTLISLEYMDKRNTLKYGMFDGPNTPGQQANLINDYLGSSSDFSAEAVEFNSSEELIEIINTDDKVATITIHPVWLNKYDISDTKYNSNNIIEETENLEVKGGVAYFHAITLVAYNTDTGEFGFIDSLNQYSKNSITWISADDVDEMLQGTSQYIPNNGVIISR